MNIRNITERAFWTAVETALAVVLVAEAGFLDVNRLEAAGVAGIAAALSVVKNAIAEYRLSTTGTEPGSPTQENDDVPS